MASDLSFDIMEILPPTMRSIWQHMRGLAMPELTLAQFHILHRLDVGPHTNQQLSTSMGISAPSMSRTVEVLVKRGYVERQNVKEDRREINLVLTQKGKKKFANIKNLTRKMLREKLSTLNKQDRRQMQMGLEVIQRVFLKK